MLRLSVIPFKENSILSESEIDAIRKLLILEKNVEKNEDYPIFLTKIFPILLNTLQNATDIGKQRILCSDTLSIWILRADQLSDKSTAFHEQVPLILSSEVLDFLYRFIIDYWDETGAPLSNSLKVLFNKLIMILKSSADISLFTRWIDQALLIKPERRVRYSIIEVLSKEVEDPEYIWTKDPEFVSTSLSLISSNALGNPVGKSLSSIYKRLYTNEEAVENWIELYWGPILSGLSDSKLSSGIANHLLPSLFKTSPTAFKIIVNHIKDNVQLFLICLNIGQQLAFEDDIISQVLTKNLIESLIIKEEFKLKVFQLLTFSSKGSKQIPKMTFEVLQQYLEIFFVCVEVETRNEFISSFKQFLYRLKDSSYALKRDGDKLSKSKYASEAISKYQTVETYKSFLVWLLDFLKLQLTPGSPYQSVITSLKIIRQLVESNLDPDIPIKVQINYSFSLSIFDSELVDLLLGNLLSTYDDIRNESSFLLLHSKVSSEQQKSITDLGFEMLNDYGKSDAGAKLLQLDYTLFKDLNIFDRLIEEIPLIEDISIAVNKPIDGYFNAIHLILKKLTLNQIPVEKILSIIEKNWYMVKDILTNDSPEGCDQYGVGSAQLVLSYGWRSTKESTLVIEELLNHKLSNDILLRIGEITIDQLGTVRHRGAFSSVYPSFIKLVSVCHTQIPEQAQNWLDQNISLIKTKTQLITRRSGGLPFLIAAIITVETDLFKYAFDQLLEIARIPVNEKDESEKMDLPQIHAFNCIKTLFIESQLSTICVPFVYKALELSLSTFSSEIWSVRNCSIMLFTALQNRLFGRKRMSAAVFFTRFKGLKAILINILTNFLDAKNLETLFPVLTILSKLEASPGYKGLEDFKPLLRTCLSVKYWKIRESASRALVALISESTEESLYLWDKSSTSNQNQLHGYLLAIKEFGAHNDALNEKAISRFEEFFVSNPSFVTAKVYLEILQAFSKPLDLKRTLEAVFFKEIKELEVDGSKQLYLKALFNNLDKTETVLEAALGSSYFELQLSAIDYCAENSIGNPLLASISKDSSLLAYTRSKAIKLINDISLEEAFEYSSNQGKYGEDLKCSAFEFLGGVVANDKKYWDDWFISLKAYSSENEPFPIRIAALKSAIRALSTKKSIEVEWVVYKFLTDDDEDIRSLASSYFEDRVVPWVNSERFIGRCGPNDKAGAIEEVISFSPSFTSLQTVKELFSVEKTNIYRNNIKQARQISQLLSKEDLNEKLEKHLKLVKQGLENFLKTTTLRLDWSIDEILFEEIYISQLYLKSFGIETNLDLSKVNGTLRLV